MILASIEVTRDETSKEEQESSLAIVHLVTGLYCLYSQVQKMK